MLCGCLLVGYGSRCERHLVQETLDKELGWQRVSTHVVYYEYTYVCVIITAFLAIHTCVYEICYLFLQQEQHNINQ